MEYQSIFKCRLCGKTYTAGCTSSEKIAMQAAIAASIGVPSVVQAPTLVDTHICKDGSIGIADFHGFRKVENA